MLHTPTIDSALSNVAFDKINFRFTLHWLEQVTLASTDYW